MTIRAPIAGVEFKSLITHADERGFFRELIRVTDDFFAEGFAQLSHSLMYAGSAKAWHFHPTQVDWWYCVGALKVALYDLREDSQSKGHLFEFFLGDRFEASVVRIPPMVAHGCRALETTHLIYVTSRTYDPAEEGRIPHDDPQIGYEWARAAPIT